MLTADSALFYDDRALRTVDPIKGGPWSFLRSSTAYEWLGDSFIERGVNQLRADALRWTGARERLASVLLEPAATQRIAAPFSFADAAWGLVNGLTRADAISVVRGRTASRLQTAGVTGGQRLSDAFGNYTGNPETACWIVEQGNHATVDLSMWDVTAADHVQLARLTFATGALAETSGIGTARVRAVFKLMDIGPNAGKPVFLAILHATRANTQAREVRTYVDTGAVSAGENVYLHYVGWVHEALSRYPFLSALLAELLTAPAPPPVPLCWSLEWTAGERTNIATGVDRAVLHIGDGITTDGRLLVAQDNDGNNVLVTFDDGTTERTLTLAATITEGARVICTGAINPADGVMRAQVRVGTGALVSGTSSSGGTTFTWGGTTPRVRVGHAAAAGTNPCRLWYGPRLFIGRAADLDDITDQVRVHDQCRNFRLNADGTLRRAVLP